jgi:Cupin-like domain
MPNLATQAMPSTGQDNLIDWRGQKFDANGMRNLSARHRLDEQTYFTDDVLVDLLDRYPRNRLQAWTMGTDPLHREDWKAVDTTGVSGEDLLAAVKAGRLWYNILRMDLFDRQYKDIVDRLYAEMSRACPELKVISAVGTLLLSSPNAQVYYHADGPPTTLFHIRGRKRMWLYPAGDTRFVSQEMMEEIFGSAMDEEVPFSLDLDQHAEVFDLGPGDMVWWPQNAPHRIENCDSLNVSLSTRYHTEESERRKLIYNSNRFLRRKLGMKSLSVKETGMGAYMKSFVYRACRRAGIDQKVSGYVYQTDLRVDPKAPLGLGKLAAPCKPSFSR